jgi:hypothetical protein
MMPGLATDQSRDDSMADANDDAHQCIADTQ